MSEMDYWSTFLQPALECQVCKEIMRPPIFLCGTGHNICFNCKLLVEQCPTCKSVWTGGRCFALEALTEKLKYRCKYYDRGCIEENYLRYIQEHEKKCDFSDRICPLWDVHICNWKGPVCEMESHFTSFGSVNYITTNPVLVPFKTKLPSCVYKQGNELFRCRKMTNKKYVDFLVWSFEHISTTRYLKPVYQVEISFKDQKNSGNVLTIIQSCENWLNSQQSPKGIEISNKSLLPFVNKNNQIEYNIKFSKINK